MKANKFFATAMAAIALVSFTACGGNDPKDPGEDDPIIVPPTEDVTPDASDLEVREGFYTICFQPAAGTVCNDIYFVGNYEASGWKLKLDDGTNPNIKMEPMANFAGWYLAYIPVLSDSTALQGKPIQADAEGNLSWDYQTGDADSWSVENGDVTIEAGYSGESNLTYNDATKPVIYKSAGWKNGNSPCVEKKIFAKVTFNLEIKGDAQEAVYLHGPFVDDSWNGIAMTKVDGNHFTIEVENLAENVEYQYTLAADNWDAKAVFEAEGEAGSGNQKVTGEVMNDVVYGFLK